MPLSDHDIELIDKYLTNSLDEEELLGFKNRLELKEFKDAVIERKTVITSLKAHKKAALRAEIAETVRNHSAPERFKYVWHIAASFIVISVIGYLLYQNASNSTTYQDLYTKYYEPFPVSTQRGDASDLDKGLKLYADGNYKEAIALLNRDNKSPSINLYRGSCFLELNELDKAIEEFSIAAKSNDLILQQHAEWYLVMTYLKKNDTKSLNNQLDKIIESNHLYKEQAQKLQEGIST